MTGEVQVSLSPVPFMAHSDIGMGDILSFFFNISFVLPTLYAEQNDDPNSNES